MKKRYEINHGRRNFFGAGVKTVVGLAGLCLFGKGINALGKSNFLERLQEETDKKLNEKIYSKLNPLVCGETKRPAVEYRGWEFYSQKTLDKEPWLKKITNARELGDFYKIINNGKEPMRGTYIKEPQFCKSE